MPTTYCKPLTVIAGQVGQLAADQGLDLLAYQLPASIGSSGQVLSVPGSGTVLTWISPKIKAWVAFKGDGTVTINSSFNVSSITDNGTGIWTINFQTALANADYVAVGTATRSDTNNYPTVVQRYSGDTKTASAVQVRCTYVTAGLLGGSTGNYDAREISVVVVSN